ncbi:MAG: hypothetical protein EOP04_02260 [Proteobacteria bacterium]|nr:MAG: hypothetical protein EOP04_02260 [Pseudomonadota bacterium]
MTEVLRKETQGLMFEIIFHAERFHGLHIKGGLGLLGVSNVSKMTSEKARGIFIRSWNCIDWKSRDSIRNFIPFFERAYQKTPKQARSRHNQIEALLSLDGFQMKNNRLIELRSMNSNENEKSYYY